MPATPERASRSWPTRRGSPSPPAPRPNRSRSSSVRSRPARIGRQRHGDHRVGRQRGRAGGVRPDRVRRHPRLGGAAQSDACSPSAERIDTEHGHPAPHRGAPKAVNTRRRPNRWRPPLARRAPDPGIVERASDLSAPLRSEPDGGPLHRQLNGPAAGRLPPGRPAVAVRRATGRSVQPGEATAAHPWRMAGAAAMMPARPPHASARRRAAASGGGRVADVLRATELPLDVRGAAEAREERDAVVNQLDDYVIPRLAA